ncbi:Cys-tRNA(Pro) deacylase [Thalassotalea ganghwensis]
MTPAIILLKKRQVPHTLHQYQHDSNASSFGLEAAEKLIVDIEKVFKTLVVDIQHQLVVAVIPVNQQLSLKSLAKLMNSKKATMAKANDVINSTGYILGGVSPLGQKSALKTFIDLSAQQHETIFISGGKRGLEIELSPLALAELTNGKFYQLTA